MGMFIVNKNSESWQYAGEIGAPLTKVGTDDEVFDTHELIIDPTGVSKFAAGPESCKPGFSWAVKGYFGFKRDGVILLVPGRFVDYA